MKKKKFYNIRVINATNEENAIEQVCSEKFDENDELCDKVLTADQLLEKLTALKEQ